MPNRKRTKGQNNDLLDTTRPLLYTTKRTIAWTARTTEETNDHLILNGTPVLATIVSSVLWLGNMYAIIGTVMLILTPNIVRHNCVNRVASDVDSAEL